MIISPKHHHNKFSAQFWQGVLIDYDGVNSYWVYSPLTKKIKIYHDVEFHKNKTTHNIDISNKFQYTEFDEYKKSETVEIDISKSINQNMSTESSIEHSIEMQNIGSSDISYDALLETTNTSIASHYSECNQQPICCWKDEFYYDSIHKIKTL